MTESKLLWRILMIVFIVFLALNAAPSLKTQTEEKSVANERINEKEKLIKDVLPKDGVKLPIIWGDLGKQLVELGVLDKAKLESLYAQRGGLTDETRRLIDGSYNGDLVIKENNANILLNLLWAFGLANKNPILEEGPMQDPRYGGAENFASTGGWTLAMGDAMDHYSQHALVTLTRMQQEKVERVAKNIYRPCCGNSTYFPDCNHGMAMLGLLEIMAAQGVSEEQMYQTALNVNSFWFPSTYLTIAKYFSEQGIEWEKADAKKILGASYSSAAGFQSISTKVEPFFETSGGGCAA